MHGKEPVAGVGDKSVRHRGFSPASKYGKLTMKTLLVVSTTFERKEDAERIARLLLDRRLIACAHIAGPITSIYRWQGKVHSSTEFTMNVKTLPRLRQPLEDTLVQEHPYELPEIVGQEIPHVSDAYYDWVCGEVQ